jgi:hypothetical protein
MDKATIEKERAMARQRTGMHGRANIRRRERTTRGQNERGGGQSARGRRKVQIEDLKSREYRDEQGNIHHHTRTSQAMRARMNDQQERRKSNRPVQSSAKLASTIAERSADQFGRAFDFAAGGVTERSSRNLEAVVQSGTIMAEMMRRMCMECGDIARGRIERSLERMVALVQSRTPQDIVALQSDIYRDNVETFLSFARRLGENSTRLADEAKRRIGSLGDARQVA